MGLSHCNRGQSKNSATPNVGILQRWINPPEADESALRFDRLPEIGVKPASKGGKKMALTDVREVINNMSAAFNPDAAQGLDAIFQYDITGEGGGNWHFTIKDGACQLHEGAHDSPTVTLTMSAETWLAIVNKETNGMKAFMSGQLQVEGDMMLAQQIEQLFPS